MIDSIVVALSGMLGNERGLNVISNNVANLNTPGFRGSELDFGNLFSGAPQNGTNNEFEGDPEALGGGVATGRTELDMTPGTQQQTGNGLDLFLQGTGFFVLQNADGGTEYTRDGSFHFDAAGDLTTADESVKVMAENASGELAPINIQSLQVSAPKATTTMTLQGSLAEEDSSFTLSNVTVYDKLGTPHVLTLQFTNNSSSGNSGNPGNPTPTPGAPGTPGAPSPGAPSPGSTVSWSVTATENGQQVGSGTVSFDAATGVISPTTSTLSMNLALQGTAATTIAFDFSQVNGDASPHQNGSAGSAAGGSNSNVSVEKQDGFAQGTLTGQTFDQNGILKLTYSNGQSVDGPTLALAEVPDTDGLVEEANSVFLYQGTKSVSLRKAGPDLQVISQSLEASNVDLTTEFSTLILMQRGYQGASQVVSTANDMLQQLLEMRGGR
jgi:flagellar hook protein FlgE